MRGRASGGGRNPLGRPDWEGRKEMLRLEGGKRKKGKWVGLKGRWKRFKCYVGYVVRRRREIKVGIRCNR